MPTRLLGNRSYIVACRVCVAGWFFGDRCGHQGSLPRSFAKGKTWELNPHRGAGRRLLKDVIGGLPHLLSLFYNVLTL